MKTQMKVVNKKKISAQLLKHFKRYWILYALLIPVVLYYVIFSYLPMYGIIIAFKDYKVKKGILQSAWVGFKHFKRLFSTYNFVDLLKNTLTLSSYSLIASYPITIIFALLLNYCTKPKFKKIVQTISYGPHFISTVIICGIIQILFMPETGVINVFIEKFGFESIGILGSPAAFKHIYVWSGIWSGTGFGAIIYISALAGVDPELHEAAIMDGASKIQRMIHIDLPSIKSTMVMILIMSLGGLMGVGFEKVYLLKNGMNSSAASTISTYVYEQGLVSAKYDYSTAVGLFNTVINLILLAATNLFCKKVLQESLF